jgi:pimeloyl-ACP methyl ester carboxylesterase
MDPVSPPDEPILQDAATAKWPKLESLERHAGTARPLFALVAADAGVGLARLANALREQDSVAYLSPGSGIHDAANPRAAEDAAAALAAVVTSNLRPGEPFLLVGYCLGGILAALATSVLQDANCRGLVLIDTPMPGHPYPRLQWSYLQRSRRYWNELFRLRREGKVASTSRHAWKRKVLWHTVRVLRPVLRSAWTHPQVKRLLRKLDRNEVPFFCNIRPISVPVLHIQCEDEPYFPMREGKTGWDNFADAGMTSAQVRGRHEEVFFRPNLARMARIIRMWTDQLPSTRIPREGALNTGDLDDVPERLSDPECSMCAAPGIYARNDIQTGQSGFARRKPSPNMDARSHTP